MSLIKEYFELTQKYQEEYGNNTIVLMQVGAFFEVYGVYNKTKDFITNSKIVEFSQICELNIVAKNTCTGNENIMMAGFKDIMIEKYIKKIQDAGFTAVIYTQDENMKNTTRSLAGIFSPGTYFHTETPNLTNSITCIWVNLIENKILLKGLFVVVGIANIDIYTGKTNLFQFKETYINNPTTYDELERFISIYNPSEVILISNLPEEKDMDYVINYAGINASLIHKIHIPTTISNNQKEILNELTLKEKKQNLKENQTEKLILTNKQKLVQNCKKQIYQKEILSKFYKFDNFEIFIQNYNEYNIATQSFCYLLEFVYQHNSYLVNRIEEPVFENCSKRLALANHSLKQLNIINDGTVKPNKLSSVSQLLNDCLTQMGKRKFLYNILNPIYDESKLQKEYDITEYYLSKFNLFEPNIKQKLTLIKDLSKFERQIVLKKISPKTFHNLYNSILYSREIFNIISNDKIILKYLTSINPNIENVLNYSDMILEYINNHLDIELIKDIEQLQQFDINFIKINIDKELDAKTKVLKESETKLEAIREYLNNIIDTKEKSGKKLTPDYVKIHETEKNNYSLLCTNRRCKLLQDALPIEKKTINLNFENINKEKETFTFLISKSQFDFNKQSAANNCINDEQINELCKNISTIKISMKDLITIVYNKFIEGFEKFQTEVEIIIQFITYIDILNTKSTLAKKYNYCKPVIASKNQKYKKSFVDVKGLRHCLIEQFQLNELYVSNDILLGDGKLDGILLYGTNAVGKTTIIKALGIAIIMAQAGLYVPCNEFYYKPYKHIFTRIIGNDNIFKGLSTFEVEMSELRTILKFKDENSLILGDELCSGTETISAISIFVAGIQTLIKSGCSFIFATHLHEIINYTEIQSLKTLILKHMEVRYDIEKNLLIYDRKLKDGSGENMYGLEVCKSLNLPPEFLEQAYEIRSKYFSDKSSLVLKSSRYNSKKLVGICEKCGKNIGTEVHHLQQQSNANEDGIIKTYDMSFHKNNLANLMTVCEECHNDIHKNKKQHKRVRTSKGMQIIET